MRRLGVVWALALCVLMFPALVPAAVAAPGNGGRSWPVAGPEGAARPSVLRAWRPPPAPWAAGHRGVDLAARAGQPVRAAAAGRVSFAGPVAGRGVLTIELSGTGAPPLRTSYEPVRAAVLKGARVAAGQVVGVVEAGPFHCPPGCLHWGLRRGDRYLDPLSLLPPSMLRGSPSRLLPVFDAPPARGRAAASPLEAAGSAAASPTGPSDLLPATALAAATAWAGQRLRGRARRKRAHAAAPSPPRADVDRSGPEQTGATERTLGSAATPAFAEGRRFRTARGPRFRDRRGGRKGRRGLGVRPGPWSPQGHQGRGVRGAEGRGAAGRAGPQGQARHTGGQPWTPFSAMATAASVMPSGSSAAPSSMRRTAASTTPCRSTAASRGC